MTIYPKARRLALGLALAAAPQLDCATDSRGRVNAVEYSSILMTLREGRGKGLLRPANKKLSGFSPLSETSPQSILQRLRCCEEFLTGCGLKPGSNVGVSRRSSPQPNPLPEGEGVRLYRWRDVNVIAELTISW